MNCDRIPAGGLCRNSPAPTKTACRWAVGAGHFFGVPASRSCDASGGHTVVAATARWVRAVGAALDLRKGGGRRERPPVDPDGHQNGDGNLLCDKR